MIDVAASSQRKRSKNIGDGYRFTLLGLISQRPSVAIGDRVPAMRFVFPHSHAFRRGRVTVDDDQKAGPGCLVEFGDGVTVIAEWCAVGNAIHLSIPAYHTAKGTQVSRRTWRLVQSKDGLWRSERIS